MDRWSEMDFFVHAAELGSLSKAAESLGMSNAAASRHLSALEHRLAARLIDRNTRRMSLTTAGNEFYSRCKSLMSELKEAEASVSASLLEPAGTLTITASISFCMKHIAPLLPEFARRYPKINIQIEGANRYYDLVDSGIDIAIRTREFEPDSQISIRKLTETRRVLAASPKYLDQHGIPMSVQDLTQHKMLIYSHANTPNELNFTRGEEKQSIKVKSTLIANDGQIIRAAALEGLGILVQPNYIIYDDIVAGRLVPILNDWHLPTLQINIAFQNRRYMPARTRLFIEFLVEHFRAQDYERKWAR